MRIRTAPRGPDSFLRGSRTPPMANAFQRTMRSFEADSFRAHGVVLLVAMAILASWLAWSMLARVSILQVASSGRIESVRAVHLVESPVAGQVIRAPRHLGDAV